MVLLWRFDFPHFVLLATISRRSVPGTHLFFLRDSVTTYLSYRRPLALTIRGSSSPALLRDMFFTTFLPKPAIGPVNEGVVGLSMRSYAGKGGGG